MSDGMSDGISDVMSVVLCGVISDVMSDCPMSCSLLTCSSHLIPDVIAMSYAMLDVVSNVKSHVQLPVQCHI